MISLQNNRLYLTLLGGFLVTASLMVKNMNVQLNRYDNTVDMSGNVLYIIGWAVVAYALSLSYKTNKYLDIPQMDKDTIMILVAVAMIVFSTIMMRNTSKPAVMYPAMYTLGWVLLAYVLNSRYATIGALFALAATMFILPWQRKMCVVDGPGIALFTAAWFLLAIANAM